MSSERRLYLTFFLTLFILAAEVAGGLISNSLALLSDAGHMVTDTLAIAMGLIAARISRKPSDRHSTFGYQRVGLLAALINGMSLLLIAVMVIWESYERFMTPPQIDIPVMVGIAAFGLAGNIAMALILGASHDDLNLKSVWLHVLGDTFSSVGVIVSGLIIYFTGWAYADPVTSVLISCVIIWGGVRLVRDTTSVFLNLTPRGFNVEVLAQRITDLPDVESVHDIHLWPIAAGRLAFSAHILVSDKTLSEAEATKKKIEGMLKENGVDHSTLQIECRCVDCAEGLYCQVGPEGEHCDIHHH